jgi:hypothetical protein
MSKPPIRSGRTLRCAVYTRKSSEEGLEQEFNSLHAQREACEAFIKSQRQRGGPFCRRPMTMAGARVATWNGRHCSSCLPRSARARSMSWSSTRSTG